VSIYDVGGLSPAAMLGSLTDPFADSSSWRHRQLMGRTALPVARACAEPGMAVQGWHGLTKGDWSSTGVELAAQHAGGLRCRLARPGCLVSGCALTDCEQCSQSELGDSK
jgi:hypothetical protein